MDIKAILGYGLILTLIFFFVIIVKDIYKSKRPGLWYSILFGIPVFFFLSFHIIPNRYKVFPKDNFTFNNTIITEDDINKLIERYNNASSFEKAAIRNEALPKKLIEKGIIEATTIE